MRYYRRTFKMAKLRPRPTFLEQLPDLLKRRCMLHIAPRVFQTALHIPFLSEKWYDSSLLISGLKTTSPSISLCILIRRNITIPTEFSWHNTYNLILERTKLLLNASSKSVWHAQENDKDELISSHIVCKISNYYRPSQLFMKYYSIVSLQMLHVRV